MTPCWRAARPAITASSEGVPRSSPRGCPEIRGTPRSSPRGHARIYPRSLQLCLDIVPIEPLVVAQRVLRRERLVAGALLGPVGHVVVLAAVAAHPLHARGALHAQG